MATEEKPTASPALRTGMKVADAAAQPAQAPTVVTTGPQKSFVGENGTFFATDEKGAFKPYRMSKDGVINGGPQ